MPAIDRMQSNNFSLLRRLDWRLMLIVALASVLRLIYPGLYQFVGDEVSLLDRALLLARHGVWSWVGNYSHSSFLAWHSPLSVYLAAIPHLLSPDPRLGRVWTGVLGVVAVVIVYQVLKRYFNANAALIGGVLLAAHAPAIDWSRFVFNPDFAQPFIALWLLTGLQGYYDNDRWAKPVHWLSLSAAIQMHPGNALLMMVSALLVALKFWRDSSQRKQVLRWTLAGGLLFGVSFVPWLIGLVEKKAPVIVALGSPSSATAFHNESDKRSYMPAEVMSTMFALAGSVERRMYPSANLAQGPAVMAQQPGNWNLPDWTDRYIFYPQAVFTWLSVLIVVGIGLWRKFHVPMLLLGLLALAPLCSYFVSPTEVQAFYLVPLVFGAIPSFAVVLALVGSRSPMMYRGVLALMGVMAAAQSMITISTLRSQYLEPNAGRYAAALDAYMDALATWDDERQGRPLVILTEVVESRKEADFQAYYWRVAAEGYPNRVVAMHPIQGLPIPAEGALLAGSYHGEWIPSLFGAGHTTGVLTSGEPMFRWVLLPESPQLPLRLLPRVFDAFVNGVRIVGLSSDSKPQYSQEWPVVLVWKIESVGLADNYLFSLRLLDEQGNRYGQVDGLSLDGSLWRAGDTVLNRFAVPVNPDYPGGPLRVQLLMYQTNTVPVVDDGGAPVAGEMMLVPDEAVADDLAWFDYYPAGRYVALTSHQYFARFNDQVDLLGFAAPQRSTRPGESIPLALYWKAAQSPTVNYHVFVHLRDENGNLVGQSDKVDPAASPTTHWTTTRYLLDEHVLTITPDTPPGRYQLYVGLWEETLGRAAAYDELGALLGDSVPLNVFVNVQP